jgi:hypothetical protein
MGHMYAWSTTVPTTSSYTTVSFTYVHLLGFIRDSCHRVNLQLQSFLYKHKVSMLTEVFRITPPHTHTQYTHTPEMLLVF